MEQDRVVDGELAHLIAEQGWNGVTIGEQYGGMGGGRVAQAAIVEGLSLVSAAAGMIVQASILGASLLRCGSGEQQRQWLPLVASGECLPTIAVTERESGGHVGGIATTATRRGDHYILNGGGKDVGGKMFVGNSHAADLHCVVARTGPGSAGLTVFLVEADRPGLHLVPHPVMLGLHGFSFGELTFTDCQIPVGNRIGAEGGGRDLAFRTIVVDGRLNMAAVVTGVLQAVLDCTTEFATTRPRYKGVLADLSTVGQRIGAIQARLLAARTLLYQTAHDLDQGRPCDPALFASKLVGAEGLLDSVRDGMAVHGAHGLLPTQPIGRLLRDAYCLEPPGGTCDIQRLRLSQHALGQDRRDGRQPWSQNPPGH
jgi:alkylation response protein AidB-like acyl-CoA dehydrogenase